MSQQRKTKLKKARRGKGSHKASPRFMAVKVLSGWLSEEPGKRPELESLGNEAIGRVSFSQRDKKLFWNILFGTVRWLRLLRWHIERYVKRFSKLPKELQAILFTGAYQIIFLSRVPFFSAVNEAVEITRHLRLSWATGLVNASLRNLARGTKVVIQEQGELLERCSGSFDNCVSNLTSHPHWMVKRWHGYWGREGCAAICINNNISPELVVRVNTLKITRKEFSQLLAKEGIVAQETEISPFGLRLLDVGGRVEEIPGFNQGLFQVQDESSQLAGLLLDPCKGDKVLDVCAGVGGKTTLIAQLMNDQGFIAACDINVDRLALLRENCTRLGIGCVETFKLPDDEKRLFSLGPFDKILIDAPCSGLGVIRRHPDIKWNRTPKHIESLAVMQRQILDKWSNLLKPGGMLVYSVCTLEEEETHQAVQDFLNNHAGFSQVDPKKVLQEVPDDLIRDGRVVILPGSYKMDGFFVAIFQNQNTS